MLRIKDLEFLGRGGHKYVYQHPTDKNKVIKIMIRERATENGGRTQQHPIRANRHQGIYRQFRREIIQYLQLCKTYFNSNKFLFPIETVYGFEATDGGLGLVTEKIEGHMGKPLTIEQIVLEGLFEEKIKMAFNRFFDDCCEYHVVYGEVNLGGIMYTESRQNRPEFVLVDGIGEKLIIPIRAMSKTMNTRNVRKVERKLKSQLLKLDNTLRFN